MTGQPDNGLDESDLSPSFVEFVEFFTRLQAVGTGPFVGGEKVGPKWHDQIFKAREWSKVTKPYLLKSDNLECKRPKQKGNYIKGKVVSGLELNLEDVGEEIKSPFVIGRRERN
jgi:hypothetical protein